MTESEDQEPTSQSAKDGDDDLDLSNFDWMDLEEDGEEPAKPKSELGKDEEAPEPELFDGDSSDSSDEEWQQEIENMEQEKRAGNFPTAAAEEEFAEPEGEAEAENQDELFTLMGSVLADDDKDSELHSKAYDVLEEQEFDVLEEKEAISPRKLSPKIIYGSVSATMLVVVVTILFVIYGPDEPQAIAVVTSSVEPEAPTSVTANVVASGTRQAAVEDEPAASVTAVPLTEMSDDVVEQTVAEGTTGNSPQQAPITTNAELAVEENLSTPVEQSQNLEVIAVATAIDTDVKTESSAISTEEVSAVVIPEPVVADASTEQAPVATDRLASASAGGADEIAILREVSGAYYIIVASFPTEILARQHAGSLSGNSETPIIIAPFGDSNRYRVAIASYETRAEIQANIDSYIARYGDDIWPLRHRVAGSTTLLQAATGNVYIIVSSFYTEEPARRHADELAATGERPVIIPPFGQSSQYRVALFNYETLEEAQEALPQHREQHGSDAWLLRY